MASRRCHVKKPAYSIAVVFLILFCAHPALVLARDENITLTTYYPSPVGVYKQLRLAPQTSPPASPCQPGTLYYNGTTQLITMCNNGPTWQAVGGGGLWALNGADIYKTNTGNVGIGTMTPGEKLDIFSSDSSVRLRIYSSYGNVDNGIDIRRRGNTSEANIRFSDMLLGDLGAIGFDDYAPVDGLIFAAGGSDLTADRKMTLSSAGNLGIGTALPASPLTIVGLPASVKDKIFLEAPATSTNNGANIGMKTASGLGQEGLDFYDAGGTQQGSILMYPNFPTGALLEIGAPKIYIVNSKMLMLSDKVGIGMAAGTTGEAALGHHFQVNDAGTATERFGVLSGTDNLFIYGTIRTFWSDARLKKNVQSQSGMLDKIMKVNPVTFNWKEEAQIDNKMHYGVIAQELVKIFPTLVYEDRDGHLSVEREEMQFILIQAVKEQQQEISELKKRLAALEAKGK
jgi:hypothetical protein